MIGRMLRGMWLCGDKVVEAIDAFYDRYFPSRRCLWSLRAILRCRWNVTQDVAEILRQRHVRFSHHCLALLKNARFLS